MPLKLMYITKDPEVSVIAQNAGVDRIFLDMEYIGKNLRQGGMDTVQNHHGVSDVGAVVSGLKSAGKKSEVLVRINPLYEGTAGEVSAAIEAGADIIMLPYFQNEDEAGEFLEIVNGRCKTCLLIESKGSMERLDRILELSGLDEVYIGLNDLSLDLGKKFMFEILADGTVEIMCKKIQKAEVPFGFGGIASVGKGDVPSEYIIGEHYRLGSECVILSRSFCNTDNITDIGEISRVFNDGIKDIREVESRCCKMSQEELLENQRVFAKRVWKVVKR